MAATIRLLHLPADSYIAIPKGSKKVTGTDTQCHQNYEVSRISVRAYTLTTPPQQYCTLYLVIVLSKHEDCDIIMTKSY